MQLFITHSKRYTNVMLGTVQFIGKGNCSWSLLSHFVHLLQCRLWMPPSRSSMWRHGFDNPENYNDHELFCGGFNVRALLLLSDEPAKAILDALLCHFERWLSFVLIFAESMERKWRALRIVRRPVPRAMGERSRFQIVLLSDTHCEKSLFLIAINIGFSFCFEHVVLPLVQVVGMPME